MTFERKLTQTGKNNPKYVDMLDEDKPIAQQKFCCVSFVSPENVIASKNEFYFGEFVKSWDLVKSMEKYAQFTSFMAFKYGLDTTQLTEDLADFCKEEGSKLGENSVSDDYKTFCERNEERLQVEYDSKASFQTNVRGLKIRGVFPSQPEAELRAKLLREADPNFDVFVGPVGVWMPWEPDAYKTGRVEFLEEELNALMSKKKENEENAKEYFEKRVKETKQKAMEDNKAKAIASGNKLTQTITPSGELINVKNMNTQLDSLEEAGESVTAATIRETLFENENVVTKNTDHGLKDLMCSLEPSQPLLESEKETVPSIEGVQESMGSSDPVDHESENETVPGTD